MAVDDRIDVGPAAIDLAMNEALDVERPTGIADRVAVHIECDDVVALDQCRRNLARQQVVLAIHGMPDADVTERIEDAFVREDPIGEHEITDGRIRRRDGCGGGLLPR